MSTVKIRDGKNHKEIAFSLLKGKEYDDDIIELFEEIDDQNALIHSAIRAFIESKAFRKEDYFDPKHYLEWKEAQKN